jgi:hypothetical protein
MIKFLFGNINGTKPTDRNIMKRVINMEYKLWAVKIIEVSF